MWAKVRLVKLFGDALLRVSLCVPSSVQSVTLFFPSETPFFFFAPFRRPPPLSLSLRHSIKALEVKLWEDLATLLPKAPRRALLDALAASDRDVGAADRFLADRSGSSSGEAPGILDTAGGRGVGRVFHLVFKGDVQCSQVCET